MALQPATMIPVASTDVYVLSDAEGGASWWCGHCGAKGLGRLLPPDSRPEAERLARRHFARCKRWTDDASA